MPHKIEILKTYFDEVWVKGNVDALATLLAPNATTRGIMGTMPFDAVELAELVSAVRALMGPITIDIPVQVEQNDWLSALVEIKSHAEHNGDPIHLFNQVIVRFDGEQMVEIYSGVHSMAFFEQLGLLPDNAMAILLAGSRLS